MGMGAFAAVEDWDERILEDLSGAPAARPDAGLEWRGSLCTKF